MCIAFTNVLLFLQVPSSAPENLVMTAVSPSTLIVEWEPPVPLERNGIIQHYIVTVTEHETANTSQILSYDNSATLYSLHPFFTYTVAVSAVTIGPGPAAMDAIQMPEDGN